MNDAPVLGLNLGQMAQQAGVSVTRYLHTVRTNGWGGYREAVIMATWKGIPMVIWNIHGRVLSVPGSVRKPTLHLFYSGCHYVVIEDPGHHRGYANLWGQQGKGVGPGDGNAAMKSRIFAKLQQQHTLGAKQLLDLLWQDGFNEVKQIRGTPEEVKRGALDLAEKIGLVYRDGMWSRGPQSSSRDKVYEADPWSQWHGAGDNGKSMQSKQDKLDQLETRSTFVAATSGELMRKPLAELLAAEAEFHGVVAVEVNQVEEALKAAARVAGSVVILAKDLGHSKQGAGMVKRLQLVTRAGKGEWSTTSWYGVIFGKQAVELVLQGVAVTIPKDGKTAMVASLREEHVGAMDFGRYAKAGSLQLLLGLAPDVFPVLRSKIIGQSPVRVALKFAGVETKAVPEVLSKSGIGQVNVSLEQLGEEKRLGYLSHIVPVKDAEEVREKLGTTQHYGVVRLKGERCMVRLPESSLVAVRKLLSPTDPKYMHAMDVQGRLRWTIAPVPLHISALALSRALLQSMNWKQLPMHSSRKGMKKGYHAVCVASDSKPESDMVVIDKYVCVIKPLQIEEEVAEAQPRIVPCDADAMMEVEGEGTSSASAVEKKVELELRTATAAMKALNAKKIEESAGELENKVLENVKGKMQELESKISKVDEVLGKVDQLASGCQQTAAAVQQLQKDHQMLEPMIQQKVQIATEGAMAQLDKGLDKRFEHLGHQLLQELSSMARKREGPEAGHKDAKRRWRR